VVGFSEESEIDLEFGEVVSDVLDGEGGCAVNLSLFRLVTFGPTEDPTPSMGKEFGDPEVLVTAADPGFV